MGQPPPRNTPRARQAKPALPLPPAGDGTGTDDLRGLPLFAAVVAHEIRNPLSAVKIALQTVERHGDIEAKDATRLRIALREVATIEKVLTSVLDWARPGELTMMPVEVQALLDDATALIAAELAE